MNEKFSDEQPFRHTLNLALHRLEAALDIVQSATQTRFDLIELLRHQRQTTEQVVEIAVHFSHASRNLSHLNQVMYNFVLL